MKILKSRCCTYLELNTKLSAIRQFPIPKMSHWLKSYYEEQDIYSLVRMAAVFNPVWPNKTIPVKEKYRPRYGKMI